jgi:hypothetical protein
MFFANAICEPKLGSFVQFHPPAADRHRPRAQSRSCVLSPEIAVVDAKVPSKPRRGDII